MGCCDGVGCCGSSLLGPDSHGSPEIVSSSSQRTNSQDCQPTAALLSRDSPSSVVGRTGLQPCHSTAPSSTLVPAGHGCGRARRVGAGGLGWVMMEGTRGLWANVLAAAFQSPPVLTAARRDWLWGTLKGIPGLLELHWLSRNLTAADWWLLSCLSQALV